jgi:hypothetical protein
VLAYKTINMYYDEMKLTVEWNNNKMSNKQLIFELCKDLVSSRLLYVGWDMIYFMSDSLITATCNELQFICKWI